MPHCAKQGVTFP
ncbi:hypothetical protein E2C01_102796 [Portunus trituberculatus]|uniref:Uncharacterized protein n=1 Tax=Portunus trituberculatus TaxID=210409 RepID=A0A5B7KND5_PORTR|nr:hypothetical protein [Portunus trituberculatus]